MLRAAFGRRNVPGSGPPIWLGLIVVIAVAAAACTRATPEARPAIPAGWKVFASQRYGYSIAYPPEWHVTEATWSVSEGIPPYYSSSLDAFDGPGTQHLRIAAQAIPEGTTLKDWTAQTLENI